jgi:hypothetical protein
MGLSPYEVDVFLKNHLHINNCVIFPISNNNSFYSFSKTIALSFRRVSRAPMTWTAMLAGA